MTWVMSYNGTALPWALKVMCLRSLKRGFLPVRKLAPELLYNTALGDKWQYTLTHNSTCLTKKANMPLLFKNVQILSRISSQSDNEIWRSAQHPGDAWCNSCGRQMHLAPSGQGFRRQQDGAGSGPQVLILPLARSETGQPTSSHSPSTEMRVKLAVPSPF